MGAKVISIAALKGGVGKSTTAWELAALLYEEDKKVLLVDLDMQEDLSDFVVPDNNGKYSIYDALHQPEAIVPAIIHCVRFDFVKSSPSLSKVDVEFQDSEDVFVLDDALDQVKDKYDFIIADFGPARNKILQMGYVASDFIICPCDDTKAGSKGLISVYTDLEKMKKAKIPLTDAVIIGAIITRYKGRTKVAKAAKSIIEDVMEKVNPKGFVATVRESIKASENKYAGKSMAEYDPYGNASLDYKDVVKQVLAYVGGDK